MKTDFPELYKKFLDIYWDGDINNALKLDYGAKEAHQSAIDSDIDQPETLFSFATKRSIEFFGRVKDIYNHKDPKSGRTVYLEKIFIVDAGTNVLRFEFGGRISYPSGVTIPCEQGGTYSFNGRIGSADYNWSHMNPRHMYATYGFRDDVTFLCLDIDLQDATCTRAGERVYTGRSFGLLSGEPFRQERLSRSNSSDSTGARPRGGCFIATAAYGVDYNNELHSLYAFRDHTLMKSWVGRHCVLLYYVISPPLAKWIAKCDWCRALVRKYVLGPIVFLLRR